MTEIPQTQTNVNRISTVPSIDERLTSPLERYYKMDHKNRGLAIIFNHESFLDFYVPIRKGTHIDRERLYKTYKNLGFDVKVYNNARGADIEKILKEGNARTIYVHVILRVFFSPA